VTAAERWTVADVRAGRIGAVDLVEALLERARDEDLGAWLLLDPKGARAQARAADAARAAGDDRPLLGVPVAVKDVVDVAGLPTTGGLARPLRVPTADAAAVAALRAAGAVVLGKAHTNELALGIDGRNPQHPPCRHPRDPERLPGGSSSGPAVAVAAGQAALGLGTDTSGSLRVPGGLCGVVALRPTPGRVSRAGVLPLAPTYDATGPIAATVADAAAMLAALSPPPSPPAQAPRAIGLVEALLEPGVTHPAVAAVVRDAVAALGRPVEAAEVLGLDDALAVHRDVQLPEAAASVRALGVEEDELSDPVRARVRAGAAMPAEQHARGHRRRKELARALAGALERHGVLAAPSAPVVAPLRDAELADLGAGRVRDERDALLSCAVPFAQGPFPALSAPAGEVDGLPVGLQLVGPPGSDDALLALAGRLEDARG
jgi:Asp-tRNA(Asn)/Glu-tRNA(Gln) amidotransferase A subunit family amidase